MKLFDLITDIRSKRVLTEILSQYDDIPELLAQEMILNKLETQLIKLKREIRTGSGHLCTITRNDKALLVIDAIKKSYKGTDAKVRLRGRGKNRRIRCLAAGKNYNHCHDIPWQIADDIAIYINYPYRVKNEACR